MSDETEQEELPWEEFQQIKRELTTLPLEALVQIAIQNLMAEEENPDYSAQIFAIDELQSRSTPETLASMIALLSSLDIYEREVAAWVLGQMQSGEGEYHAFQDEAVDALLQGLARWHDDPRTLESIGVALGHRNDPRAIPALVALKAHPDARVRFGVVFGLDAFEEPLAVATLLELTGDPADKVRNWATFAFTYLNADSPTIRAALFARTTDPDIDIRSEAIEALAVRHDSRTLPALLAAIADGANGSPILDAARQIADPQLYPVLVALRGMVNSWDNDTLEEAIAACTPKTRKPLNDGETVQQSDN